MTSWPVYFKVRSPFVKVDLTRLSPREPVWDDVSSRQPQQVGVCLPPIQTYKHRRQSRTSRQTPHVNDGAVSGWAEISVCIYAIPNVRSTSRVDLVGNLETTTHDRSLPTQDHGNNRLRC